MAEYTLNLAPDLATKLGPMSDRVVIKVTAKAATFISARCPRGPDRGEGHVHTQDTVRASMRQGIGLVTVGGAAAYLEFGTPPHPIDPKHPKEALYWEGADHPVAHVDHPGTQPNPFIRNGAMDTLAWLKSGVIA